MKKLERKTINRKTKRVICLALEGKNITEKNYFNNFNIRNSNYKLIFTPGNETDPLNMVKQLIKTIKEEELKLEQDKAFCIFDTDTIVVKNNEIIEAKKLADENGIVLIPSSPCFEMWFLLHFQYSTAFLDNEKIIKKINRFIPNYKKNNDIFEKLNNKLQIAIDNSKKLEEYQLSNGKKLCFVECNPYSAVYKVVEEFSK